MKRRRAAPVRLGYALIASVVAGLVLAAVALPVVGGLGLTAKAGAEEFLVLPAELTIPPLAQRTRILAADGKTVLAVLYRQNRVNAPLQDVPELARKAVIATEDARFYAHNGIDYKGTLRAAVENAQAGGVSQGGSTLTQQYVKNALLQAARGSKEDQDKARELTLDRKLKEARYALAIEKELTKDQILERYLNIAYYGNGVYGMGTAASFYFNKPIQQLTLAEGALLAGLVQTPSRFDPVKAMSDPVVMETVLARRDIVLNRMRDVGFITEAQRAEASAERGLPDKPLFAIQPVVSGCENPEVAAPFFCDYVRRALEDTDLGKALGNTREERQDKLLAGGLTIVTTLDPRIQQAAQKAVEEAVPIDDPFGAGAVVDVVEPGTGHVRAMAVNRRYSEQDLPGHSKVNLAIGGSSGFQAGSTFKPFVLAEAIKQGVPLGFPLYAPQKYTSKVFKDYVDGRVGPYTPSNAGDSQSGRFTLETATHASVNTYYVQLEERVGVEPAAALAETLGVKQFKDGVPAAPLLRGGAFVLGANEVSPLDMAAAYATFAARGLYCPPRPVTQVLDARGQPIELGGPGCAQVLEQPIADTINSVLTGIIDGDTRGRTGRAASIGRPAAGKTGSTNGSKAAWFVGYTPQLATAVWMGDPGASGRPVRDMRSVRINGRFYPQVFGGTIPAGIWQKAMREAMNGFPVVGFPKPGREASDGKNVAVPDVRGLPQDVAESTLISAGFSVRKGGRVSAAPVPAGAAAYTSPRAGRTVTFGSSVTLFVSTGRRATTESPAPRTNRVRPAAPEGTATAPAPPESTAPEPKGRGNGRGKD
ncbi:MAG: transglycosylase domain-containing protein [Actinobacteria bacterium]|nr:transglycosylase domain-containing protein [Actinomycetota bacterium]